MKVKNLMLFYYADLFFLLEARTQLPVARRIVELCSGLLQMFFLPLRFSAD